MKPERIQFAPWDDGWDTVSAFIRKVFACESLEDATHCVHHVQRVARVFTDSEVKTSISEDNRVTVKILPTKSESITDAQYDLGQEIDEALSYLTEDATPDVLN